MVIADGFYEWRKADKSKMPMRIVLKTGEPFCFAGLWETWKSPEGELVKSCTIITTVANALIEPIHNRMPVILSRDEERTWLDLAVDDISQLREFLVPYEASQMEAYKVSSAMNSAIYDHPNCIAAA